MLSLDSVCIGIGSSIGRFATLYFPIFVASFQLIFLSFGIFIGNKISKTLNIPDKIWNIISSLLLITFGIIKLFF